MSISALAPLKRDAEQSFEAVVNCPTAKPFDSTNIAFIRAMRRKLLSAENKLLPELVALGFWLRRFESLIAAPESLSGHSGFRKALGTVVHFTPSNVDTMFVYSWICGLVMGNRNIVRVASADSQIQDRFFVYLNELFEETEFDSVKRRNVFVKFERDSQWSSRLSLLADARVL